MSAPFERSKGMSAKPHTKSQTNRMSKIWKLTPILIVGACSLALSLDSVSCFSDQSRPSSVSYAQQRAFSQTQKQFKQHHDRANEIARLAESRQNADYYPMPVGGLMDQGGQPSVYHSIIDRTDAGSSLNVSPAVQTSTSTIGDLKTAAGHHHGHAHGKYYEYRAVPKKKTWKFGYKRGNHKHTISRHEHGKAGKHPHFKTKVKWHDKKSKGKGIHLWDYNHHDKKHYHHG